MKKLLLIFLTVLLLAQAAVAQTIIVQNEATAARRRIPVFLADSTDHITGVTGKGGAGSSTCIISKAGGAAGGCATVGLLTEINSITMPGWYYYEATAAEVNTAGILALEISATGVDRFHALAQVLASTVLTCPTASEISDAVLDETMSGHLTSGTVGNKLNQCGTIK